MRLHWRLPVNVKIQNFFQRYIKILNKFNILLDLVVFSRKTCDSRNLSRLTVKFKVIKEKIQSVLFLYECFSSFINGVCHETSANRCYNRKFILVVAVAGLTVSGRLRGALGYDMVPNFATFYCFPPSDF